MEPALCDCPGCLFDGIHRTKTGRLLCSIHAHIRHTWAKTESLFSGAYRTKCEEWDTDYPKRKETPAT